MPTHVVPATVLPRRLTIPLLTILSALLGACDDGTTGGGTPQPVPVSTISGTVTLPGATSTALPHTRPLRPGEVLRASGGQPWAVQGAAHSTLQSGAVIPGEYLIVSRTGLSAQTVSATLSALAVPTVGTLRLARAAGAPTIGLSLYRADRRLSAVQSSRVLTTLAAQPGVISVSANRRMDALATPNDMYYPLQWHYPAINLPEAWNHTTGKAITVAVVDTGIITHPDLSGQVLPGMDFISDITQSGDGDGIDTDPTDPGGSEYHGSHVAGTIGARSNNGIGVAGVDWAAKILPVRVLNQNSGSLADILMGTLWAAGEKVDGAPMNPNPARVINLSLGGAGDCTAAEQQVFSQLKAKGVVTVVAAGNDNVDATTISPANCADVITVGAVGPDGRRAPYSNYGPRIDVMAPGGNSSLGVTVGADTYPGGVLSTTYDDATSTYQYEFLDGTSMASPHVAGAVALLLGQNPALTPAQVLARLKASAVPLGSRCDITDGCGAGLIDASALLTGVTPTPVPTPTPTPPSRPPLVEALYMNLSNPAQPPDYRRSASIQLPLDSLAPGYVLKDLQAGSYLVRAWQDLNGDGKVNEGEPYAEYPNYITVTTTAQDITGIDLTLQAYSVQSAGLNGSRASLATVKAALETLIRMGR
ncbi:subtilisin-like serine protease [Deinococcus sp. KSM4-11]|uniref:S8 family peptidase n=1 Tax=Deinococcus sp. KSM4-11 TaxID=2568654 RepID=UPI0010A3C7AA|nr:S8 family serine peptidase [Deinococcus sp. KSM4-11]THF88066.1 subtilisin-like serine protease [Deinococcus sp. KSM4-11]